MLYSASYNTWRGDVLDGDDLTEKIAQKLGVSGLTILGFTAQSDAMLTLESSPPDNLPNAATMLGSGGVFMLDVPNAADGLGTQGARKITVRGSGHLIINFWYKEVVL